MAERLELKPLLSEENADSSVVDITVATDIPVSMEESFCDISKKDGGAMKTVKEILGDEKGHMDDIHILVVGNTGQGKSALVNSIIERDGEELAAEGAKAECCTKNTCSYIYPDIIPGMKIIVTDTPGLQDTNDKNQEYVQEIKNKAHEVSVVLFCMKMTEHRIHNDDKAAIKELHQAFGPKFWERVIFVFTFANKEDYSKMDERDEPGPEPPYQDEEAWKELIKKRFIHRIELRASSVKDFLKEIISIDGIGGFVPAGTCKRSYECRYPMHLPDRKNWLYDLLKLCYDQIKIKHRFTKLRLNNKIHLAVIFDNRLVKIEENESKNLSSQADALKNAFKNLGFFVIHFNGLSSQSIFSFLQFFKDSIDPSQLSLFALVFLSKGKTPQLYNCNNEVVPFQDVFHFFAVAPTSSGSSLVNVPKLFFFDLAAVKDKALESFALPQCPDNTVLLAVAHKNVSALAIEKFADKLSVASVQKCVRDTFDELMKNDNEVKCIMCDTIGSKFFIDKSINKDDKFLLKQLEVLYSLWYPIRNQTIEELTSNKDELMSIVHTERIARIAASSASIALGGSLVVAGIALAPFTFGASIGLSVAGGVVGGLASLGGIGAFIASKVTSNKHLKKAQEHISLDQQLSLQINNIVQEISAEPSSTGEIAGEVAAGGAMGVADVSRFGAGVAIGLEGALEGGAFALRGAGRFAGMVLAGVSLAVTVPIDIGFIAYHSYHIHQSSKDKTGKTDSNKAIKWLISQIEEMIKGTCIIIDVDHYPIEDELDIVFDKPKCGYKITVPQVVSADENPSMSVSTIFFGPFIFPEGYTLVSAVYDVVMPGGVQKPAIIELEHCINVSDESVASKMCFALATINLEQKVFEFTQVNDDGIFRPGDTYGSISQAKSCYLCILYDHSGPLQHTSMKYAAHCCYEKQNRNCWKISVIFTKYLSAHFKYAKVQDNAYIQHYPFTFKQGSPDARILVKMECLKSEVLHGWRISHKDKIQSTICKEEIDFIESKKEFWMINSGIFPSFSFYAHVVDSDAASELSRLIGFEGTDLELIINCQKE